MDKQFTTYEQQLQILRDKNLMIPDAIYAERWLRRLGYFGLVCGYKAPFKNRTTGAYRDGVRFEDIALLYQFDEDLREMFLRRLLYIERHIRSLLSYYFTEKYGIEQVHYLSQFCYENNPRNKHLMQNIKKVTDSFQLLLENENISSIRHCVSTHENVPLWVVIQEITFGTLSKMYRCLTPDMRMKIAGDFQAINEKQLSQMLFILADVRNICAHSNRLFSFRAAKKSIPDLPLHAALGIERDGTTYLYGKQDLFSVVIAFRYLLPTDEFVPFQLQLSTLVETFALSTDALSEKQLLDYMGFPEYWRSITKTDHLPKDIL